VNDAANPANAAPLSLAPTEFLWAIVIAAGLSLLIACIEIPSRAKSPFRACRNGSTVLYWLVLSFGNIVTTLLASIVVVKLPASLSPYYFLIAAFFGVFGFETVLKNTNITMFDKGVLTIQNWIEKALNAAAASAIDENEKLKEDARNLLVEKLKTLREDEINTRILQRMGPDAVKKLDAEALASSANSKLYKAFQLANTLSPSEAAALLRTKKG